MSRFADLSGPVIDTANRLGAGAIGRQVDALIDELWRSGPPPVKEATRLIKALRGNRCFADLLRVTDTLLSTGYDHPPATIYLAQALIEHGHLSAAERALKQSLNNAQIDGGKVSVSEAKGLLGRLNKQRFVNATGCDASDAAEHLRAAIKWHEAAYAADPIWHGPNIVALAWRAGQDGIALDGIDAESAERRLLDDVARERAKDEAEGNEPGPWSDAAAAQALMALGEWGQAARHYAIYASAADNAFMLMGDYRQLQEIWGIVPDGPRERARLLAGLAANIIYLPGGCLIESPGGIGVLARTLDETAQTLSDDERDNLQRTDLDEGLIDGSAMMPRTLVRRLDELSRHVCQVVDRRLHANGRKSGGTGFLVSDGMFKNGSDATVLATNAHVLSADGGGDSVPVAEAKVIFHNWNGEECMREFDLSKLLWSSTRSEHDLCLAEVSDLPAGTPSVPISKTASSYAEPSSALDQPIGRAYLMGHPQGRKLEYSFETPSVVDHNLHLGPNGVRRIHYRTPTEKGSSGSPVFDGATAEVVGIHCAEVVDPIPGSPKPFPAGSYHANEAIGLHAAARQACDERG
jgi:hypothetical protein